jgi:hypothetical protein
VFVETYGDRNLICSCAPIEAYVTPIVTDHSKMPRHYQAFFSFNAGYKTLEYYFYRKNPKLIDEGQHKEL